MQGERTFFAKQSRHRGKELGVSGQNGKSTQSSALTKYPRASWAGTSRRR